MVRKVVDSLVQWGCVSPGEQEVIAFGLEQGFYSMLGVAVALILSSVMGIGMQGMVFLTAFIPLRTYAGGYHAASRKSCGVISVCMLVGIYLVLKYWRAALSVTAGCFLITGIVIYMLLPVDTPNHRFEDGEREAYRRRGRWVLGIEAVVFAGACLLGYHRIAEAVLAAYAVETGLLLTGIWKK